MFGTTYTVPVVFHIMHSYGTPAGSAENLSDATVVSALAYLNAFYRGVICSGDTTSPDTGIQFCLARSDGKGRRTTGISRHATNLTDMKMCCDDAAMKSITKDQSSGPTDAYPPDQYVNIWVVNSICPDCIPLCDVAGYATMPGAAAGSTDGIVVEANTLGSCEGVKTLVHEMGHYLGLLHPFQNGCKNGDCLVDGDGVCDTPPVDDFSIYNYDCTAPGGGTKNSCKTDVNFSDPNNPFTVDQLDLQQNFMDYSPASCKNSFTKGQVDRMIFYLTNTRNTLLASGGCNPPTDTTASNIDDTTNMISPPASCPTSYKANLIRGRAVVCAGDVANFSTFFVCNTPNNWTLSGDGMLVNSTNTSIQVSFKNPGNAVITLRVLNVCNTEFTDTVNVKINPIPDLAVPEKQTIVCSDENPVFHPVSAGDYFNVVNEASGYASIYKNTGTISLPFHASDSCYFIHPYFNNNFCTVTDSFCVKVICADDLDIPSAFTPNGDNLNDILKPIYYKHLHHIVQLQHFNIFDRWGNLVFTSSDVEKGWDGSRNGKKSSAGTFVWTLDYTSNGKLKQKRGTVILVR